MQQARRLEIYSQQQDGKDVIYGAADQEEMLLWETSLYCLATEDVLIYRNMEGCKSIKWSLRRGRKVEEREERNMRENVIKERK